MDSINQLYQNCQLCPRRCGVDRTKGERGLCQAPAAPKVAKTMLHHWEEPCISGTCGSGTVFFSHCQLKCCFCQNYKISHEGNGKILSESQLAECFLALQDQGAHNINLVSPTIYLPSIITGLDLAKKNGLTIPVLYNSNGYELPEMLQRLNGYIDIYLPDLKYYSTEVANRLSKALDYYQIATQAILTMFDQVGAPQFNEEGLMTRGLLIRHLVLPHHLSDSQKVLDWIGRNLPSTVYLSLMAQYFPTYHANQHPLINRCLTQAEYDRIVDYCINSGFENGFIQELSSADECYVPEF